MTSRYTKPMVNKDLFHNEHLPTSINSSPPLPSSSHLLSSSHSPSPPPYNDHILSIPSDTTTTTTHSSFSSATSRSDIHRRRQKQWEDQHADNIFLPHDKLYKAELQKVLSKKKSRNRDWRISIALFLWALYIRFWKIWQPSSVVFDEVHFGGFASKYIKTRFFMDVHPPLAKMLIALVGKLAGFDGHFDFKNIGDEYIEAGVPYISMRNFCALNGVLVVPIAYWTLRGSGHSIAASIVAALMICYENGLIANNRLILLDPPLLLFTSATILMWVNFSNQSKRPFQFWWWAWLALTGLGLGLTVSCKWVGLFTIATIGVSTVYGLWQLWGDTHVSINRFLHHFAARALCLIFIPIIVYMIMFQIHFISLPNSGEGDGFMSPQFQQTLDGHSMQDTPIDIAYGSKLFIRHVATRGGYLHSHLHNYPTGSKQQQVTLYPHRDDNNWWTIHKQSTEEVNGIEYVKNGDIVRLTHADSSKRLHSHNHRPPMTDLDYHNEVSTYGFPDFEGDANDYWRVEIIDHDKKDPQSKDRLRTLHSKFRLIHAMEGCALFSHDVKLPEWGWGQQEVTCIKNGKIPKTIWYIESTMSDQLPPNAEKVNYQKPSFFSKFIELNQVMWDTNKGLTQSHPYDSRPKDWPFLRRGINFWGKNNKHIYLLGNPIIYWCSSIAIGIYFIIKLTFLLLDKRGYKTDFRGLRQFYENSAGFFVIGWFLHYIPFFLMGRQLFLHHYMPALYFSILTFAVGFDLMTIKFIQRKRLMIAFGWLLFVIYIYRCFVPITYGEPWTKSLCLKAKWRSTWDFDCNTFFDNLSDYNEPKSINIGDTFEKFQNAFNSYISSRKDHELAPEVADIVNKVSDAVNNQKNIEGKKEEEISSSNSEPTNDSKTTLDNVD